MRLLVKSLIWLCLSILALSCQTPEQSVELPRLVEERRFDPSLLSDIGKNAYEKLAAIDLFAVGGIGEAGETSPGELALRDLAHEKEAVAALRQLVTESTPEGGLYALLGLKLLRCDCFEVEHARFAGLPDRESQIDTGGLQMKKGEIRRMAGCEIYSEDRLKVAKDIAEGNDEIINWAIKKWPNNNQKL
ncbi:MAG: hypothetical protein IPM25_12565 [Chloracidobacterium sp.]|nr:hypothetical protein [Chloracidobacterium sp.]